jgi:ribonuclease G
VNELIVETTDDGLQIALLEDKRLVELHHEKKSSYYAVGDVFLGKVKRVLPGLNAVFVDVGFHKDAFLHYSDLGPQILTQLKFLKSVMSSPDNPTDLSLYSPLPDIDKNGKIGDVLRAGMLVPVQIMKEAISSKGPRLSSQLSLAGQYIILMPFSSDVSVSRKFKSIEEKRRVKRFLEGIVPRNVGIIVRTAAEGVDLGLLEDEFAGLMERFENLARACRTAAPGQKILSELDRTTGILRDMLSTGFDAIYTDDAGVYNEIAEFLDRHQPELRRRLHLKKSRVGIFEAMGVDRQIKSSFGKTVNLSNGAYIVVEHTEALHVFDVNSGSAKSGDLSPEENALRINLEAAKEIARQLRLRDMGGIIVVDFIDQRSQENRRKIYQYMKDCMEADRARHTVLPMSPFGLIQITRHRVRPEVTISTDENCPSCNGTGKIQPSILLADEVIRNVDFLIQKNKVKKLTLAMNPFLAAYFKQGFPSIRWRWLMKYGMWIGITSNAQLPFTTVKYYDGAGEAIKFD